MPFDPVVRGVEMEGIVFQALKRLYYRFRPARFYGGIATADAVGCSFLCAYCWNYGRNLNPGRYQDYYSPHEAASFLLQIAQKNNLNLFRVSGAEPLLGERSFRHLHTLIQILFRYRDSAPFILETNGLYLGYYPDQIELLRYMNVKVRVSLKGIDEESFENLTGAERGFFKYPLIALRELHARGVTAWPTLMGNFFAKDKIRHFERFLQSRYSPAPLEVESLKPFPFVSENMKRRRVEAS